MSQISCMCESENLELLNYDYINNKGVADTEMYICNFKCLNSNCNKQFREMANKNQLAKFSNFKPQR